MPREMKLVLHGEVESAVAEALQRHGHEPHAQAELELATQDYVNFLRAAQSKQWDVLTADDKLVDAIYAKKIWFNRSIIFLQLPGGAVEQDDAIDRLFTRYKRLTPERMYTVTETRVKIRQLPRKL